MEEGENISFLREWWGDMKLGPKTDKTLTVTSSLWTVAEKILVVFGAAYF